ncbi:MAG: serine/threonine protein kinase [Gammaproteobacteria bacterium]|jgi:serine/threonine protein kinase
MTFANPLALFLHLFAIDEENMLKNLAGFIEQKHGFYADVLALIAAHVENKNQTSFGTLIGQQAELLVEDNIIHNLAGKQAGLYKLIRKLGQGGMGAVYLGARNDGQLEQKVAIKFVYPSIVALAGEDFLQAEAQHLANVDHANIAKIFTVGTTVQHLPYMVMEYVDGLPIDQYCEQHQLNTIARLKLFQKVCNAVHAAHQNMIIHSDIKPSNILVDKQGNPKLIDFGIARTIKTANEQHKSPGLSAASREFASPEQLAQGTLTTACDIYAVGKTLAHSICNPNKELMSLQSKALAHHAADRYQTILELNDDINAYLETRPLKAHVAFLYVLKKHVQRNFALSGLSFLIVCSVIVFAGWQNQQKSKLNQQIALKEATLEYINQIFSYADPNISTKGDLSAKDLLNSALTNLDNAALSDGKVKASIYNMLGGAFYGLSSYEESKVAFEHSLSQFDNASDAASVEYIEAMNNLAGAQRALGNMQQAKDLYLKVYAMREDVPEEKRAIYLNNIARIMFEDKDYPKAIETFQSALKLDEKVLGQQDPQIAIRHSNIASVYQKMENFDLAIKHVLIAIEIDTDNYGEQHPNIAVSYNKLGSVYRELNQLVDSITFLEKALAIGETTIGKQHHYFGVFTFNYAKTLIKANRLDDGLLQLQQALSIFKVKLGEQHPTYIQALKYKDSVDSA